METHSISRDCVGRLGEMSCDLVGREGRFRAVADTLSLPCRQRDWYADDRNGNMYYFNVCGDANEVCAVSAHKNALSLPFPSLPCLSLCAMKICTKQKVRIFLYIIKNRLRFCCTLSDRYALFIIFHRFRRHVSVYRRQSKRQCLK